MLAATESALARDLAKVARELRELVTAPPYLADRAPYAAGRGCWRPPSGSTAWPSAFSTRMRGRAGAADVRAKAQETVDLLP